MPAKANKKPRAERAEYQEFLPENVPEALCAQLRELGRVLVAVERPANASRVNVTPTDLGLAGAWELPGWRLLMDRPHHFLQGSEFVESRAMEAVRHAEAELAGWAGEPRDDDEAGEES
jgi:hypothetical protein